MEASVIGLGAKQMKTVGIGLREYVPAQRKSMADAAARILDLRYGG